MSDDVLATDPRASVASRTVRLVAITAAGWFVANPQVTVVDVRRLQRLEHAVNEFLDKVG